jgi:hypothetical protein
MKKSIGGLVVCLLGLVACNVERYDDCDGDDFDDRDAFGGSHSRAGAGSTSGKAGSPSTSAGTEAGGTAAASGGTGSTGTAGAAAGGEVGAEPPDACDRERDCAAGYNCDIERRECLPADEETCGELETEAACTHRSDCTPIYGGTNCSCGPDCECKGGEPGCVCQSFQFFACEAASQ